MEPRDPYAPPPPKPRGEPAGAGAAPRPPAGPEQRRGMIAGRLALISGLSGLLLTVVPPVGMLLDALAIGVAVRARRLSRAHGVPTPGAMTGAVLGVVGLLLVTAALILLWDESRAYERCISGANTEIAKENCNRQFRDDIEKRFGVSLPG